LNLILGVTQFAKGLFDDAMQDFLRTSRKFPDLELPLYFLGLAGDAIKRNLPETLDLVQAYSNRHPDQFWPFYFLGHAAFQAARASHASQDLQEAESLLKKSIELNPGYAESHLDLGNVYFQQKLWQQAVQEYQKAISLQPALTEAHFRLYRAYLQVGDSTRAQREMEIHQRLQRQEEQASARQRQVTVFLYNLHK
jgi:tetratricopeptide (TPR) repeat protein